jgi:transcriptional regulator with XRE-family HTH domain
VGSAVDQPMDGCPAPGTSDETDFIYGELGRRIKAVRKGLRLSQESLSRSIGLSRASIANIERGRQRLPLHVLYEISKALRIELRALMPSRHFIQEARDDQGKQKAFCPAELNSVDALEDKIGSRAEEAAKKLLESANRREIPVEVESIARELGLPIENVEGVGSVAGALLTRHGRTLIVVNPSMNAARRRFVIAHEIGHFLMHMPAADTSGSAGSSIVLHFWDETNARAIDLQDRQANRFAAELLVPKDALFRDIPGGSIDISDEGSVASLAAAYGVDAGSMLLRLASLSMLGGSFPPPWSIGPAEGSIH